MGEVDRTARAFAGALHDRGIGPGDVVLFQLPNWVEAATIFWGAAYAGAIVVPVVHFYGAKELAYIVEVTDPAMVITADRFAKTDYVAGYAEFLGAVNAPWYVVGDTPATELPTGALRFDSLLGASPVSGPVAVDAAEPAIIAFTSGTTSNPKGVIHSHNTIGFEAQQLTELSLMEAPPSITGAPVGHFIGMLSAFLCSLIIQRPINLLDVWNPSVVLRLMRDEGLGMAGGAAYFVTSLIDHPDWSDEHLANMPYAGLGGSPVPAALTDRLSSMGIKVYRSYGSTEHPSVTGCTTDDPEHQRNLTDGKPMRGSEVRLDADGQILTRGPELFMGYIDPAQTAKVFDEDGWYYTGDIGTFDDEGCLSITDRLSDVIIRGGENISAQEVEELLFRLDGVAEVAVVAVPDAKFGERAAAVIRVRDGAEMPTLDDVRTYLGDVGLAKQKWPESIVPIAEFPRTPSGKVQKFVLRQWLRDATTAD